MKLVTAFCDVSRVGTGETPKGGEGGRRVRAKLNGSIMVLNRTRVEATINTAIPLLIVVEHR
jgi:hypothetical protein